MNAIGKFELEAPSHDPMLQDLLDYPATIVKSCGGVNVAQEIKHRIDRDWFMENRQKIVTVLLEAERVELPPAKPCPKCGQALLWYGPDGVMHCEGCESLLPNQFPVLRFKTVMDETGQKHWVKTSRDQSNERHDTEGEDPKDTEVKIRYRCQACKKFGCSGMCFDIMCPGSTPFRHGDYRGKKSELDIEEHEQMMRLIVRHPDALVNGYGSVRVPEAIQPLLSRKWFNGNRQEIISRLIERGQVQLPDAKPCPETGCGIKNIWIDSHGFFHCGGISDRDGGWFGCDKIGETDRMPVMLFELVTQNGLNAWAQVSDSRKELQLKPRYLPLTSPLELMYTKYIKQ